MAQDYPVIPADQHDRILREQILQDPRYTQVTGGHPRPKAIVLAGQPGAGKGGLVRAALSEMGGDAAVLDPDELRNAHPDARNLRSQKPYTWSGDTHGDASRWAQELRADAIAQRKNLVLDTTMPRADVIKDLQAKGYDVEIRAIATHRLESELGVDKRFSDDLDRRGYGRYVPQEVRSAVYEKLPDTLDDVAQRTGVPIQIYDREGQLHYDSRTHPNASPGQALKTARDARLTPERLKELHQSTEAQRQWHRELPEHVPNERVGADTAHQLLNERQTLGVEQGVQQLHNEVGGRRAVPRVIKGAGIVGAVYGAYEGKQELDAAIDTARSNREQWIKGGEATADLGVRSAVTGTAATVGAIPGATAGALTSPVTGPVGPVVGGLATGGAAAYGAEQLYKDSRLQQFSRFLGREVGELGYDYLSREGRLLREVNGLKEELQAETDPKRRVVLEAQLAGASERFGVEVERNGRYFQGRAGIDQSWEQMHARFPEVDKDDVNDALDKHINAGKRPDEAARAAYSDAVHEKYPRALPYQPEENYRALSSAQLLEMHRQYAGRTVDDKRAVTELAANRDSHNNVDRGWPPAYARQRQAQRVEEGLNRFWKDAGHLGAIRNALKERGLAAPELPQELQRSQPDNDKHPSTSPTNPSSRADGHAALSPEQERLLQHAYAQLAPGLAARGHTTEQIQRISAAAVGHAQQHAVGETVPSFHLSKDGSRVAMVRSGTPITEFGVQEAQSQTAEQHLSQAPTQMLAQTPAHQPSEPQAQSHEAVQHTAPQRAMA